MPFATGRSPGYEGPSKVPSRPGTSEGRCLFVLSDFRFVLFFFEENKRSGDLTEFLDRSVSSEEVGKEREERGGGEDKFYF